MDYKISVIFILIFVVGTGYSQTQKIVGTEDGTILFELEPKENDQKKTEEEIEAVEQLIKPKIDPYKPPPLRELNPVPDNPLPRNQIPRKGIPRNRIPSNPIPRNPIPSGR